MAAAASKSLPQRPKGAVQGVRSHALGRKVGRPQGRVGRGRSPPAVTMVYALPFKRTTSSVTALRAAHLPLNRQLRCLGKAFGSHASPRQIRNCATVTIQLRIAPIPQTPSRRQSPWQAGHSPRHRPRRWYPRPTAFGNSPARRRGDSV